jgi:hypothetical protein
MGRSFSSEAMMSTRRQKKLVHEGQYAAEVEIELIETDDAWSPHLSVSDARKLDEVRVALKRGDVMAATKLARVFRLTPISAA